MRDLVLYSCGLLSKWGFEDGEILRDWLADAEDELGVPWTQNSHSVLRRLVREHLLPQLTQDVVAYDIDTIHNPIRAQTVDGVEIDDYADNSRVELTPDHVTIPAPVVLRAIADADSWTDEQRMKIPAITIEGELAMKAIAA